MRKIFLIVTMLLTFVSANFNFGECSGSGTFEQQIEYYGNQSIYDLDKAVLVGTIPQGIQGLRVELISDKDVDIRLYGENGDKIVHWPYGILSGPVQKTKPYRGIPVTYSGYNGSDGEKGHEFIEVNGTTPTAMTMKAFGYQSGYATVNYSWTGKEGCTPNESGEGNFTQILERNATSLVGTIPPKVNNVKINLSSDKDLDIQLYGKDGTAIVAWKPKGLISGPNIQSVEYHGMHITWSGYNGTDGHKGDEYIRISGETTEVLVMKIYGYEAGSANVDYYWGDADTTPPVITLNGGDVTLTVGDTYTELGATATDDRDGDITSRIAVTGTVDTSTAGTYEVTYSVSDTAGNAADLVTRIVTVQLPADTTPPVITLNGGDVTLTVGDTYTELGATATDDRDGDITSRIAVTGTVDTSTAGTYQLTYSVSDTAGNQAQLVRNVVVEEDHTTTVSKMLEIRVADGNDDVEEHSDGYLSMGSSDLEMTQEHDQQHIGIRYPNLTIPQGAEITKAYLQFQVDETTSGTANLQIAAEDSDNAAPFVDTQYNLTSRTTSGTPVAWNPPDWTTIGEHSLAQRTDDLKTIIQPLVNKSSWSRGNAIVFIISGEGKRVAESFDGESAAAPLLHIEYTIETDSSKVPPVITLYGDQELMIEVNSTYTDNGASAIDNIDGNITGNIVINNPVDVTKIGDYIITYNVTDSDGNHADEKQRIIHVVASSTTPLFRKAPYLLYSGNNSEMLLVWQLKSAHTTTIAWGENTNYALGSKTINEYNGSHQYKTTFTGLTPGTKYYYKVTVDSNNIQKGSFRTGAESTENTISFYLYGDTRSQPESHDLVAKAIMQSVSDHPNSQTFIVSSGDLVSNGEEEEKWDDQFFDPQYTNIQYMLGNLPYVVSVGNHAGNGKLFGKYFPYPMYASDRYYYSFDYGPVHFTVIDQFTDYSLGSTQYNWIKNDLESSHKTWKFILLHKPGWSAGGHSNSADVQNLIQPLCVDNGVQMVVAGHNHYYARAVVDGVEHITTGGGGAPLYDPDSGADHIVKIDKSHHFIKIDISGDTLHFSAIRSDGSVIETFDRGVQ